MKATATNEESKPRSVLSVPKPRFVYTRPNITENESVEEKDQMVSCICLLVLQCIFILMSIMHH